MVDKGAVVGLVRVVRAARGEGGEEDLVPLRVVVHVLQPLVSVFAGERVRGQGPLANVLGKGDSLRDDRSCMVYRRGMVNRGSMVDRRGVVNWGSMVDWRGVERSSMVNWRSMVNWSSMDGCSMERRSMVNWGSMVNWHSCMMGKWHSCMVGNRCQRVDR